MKNVRFFANVVKTVAAIAVLGLSFVSCNKEEDGLGAANAQDKKSSLVITEKEEPKPTPKDSLWENSWVTVVNTVIDLDWQYFKNDTVVNSLKDSTNVAAQIARNLEKVETTVNHLNNLGITAGQVLESRDRNNYVFRQTMTDLDGQTYNGLFKSGYATLKDLQNVHGKLVGFQTTGFRNIPQPTPEDMDTLVITRVGWKAIFEVENAKNLAGQTFEIALDSTDHFRYIKKNAPTLLYSEPFKHKYLGVWNCGWTIGKYYYWSNNTVTADSMSVNLKASYETIELKDKVVNNLENYSHDAGSLKFKERTAAKSNDTRVKKYDNTYEKKSYATNGFESDQFYTLFTLTVQDAIVEFCDSTWTIEAEDVAMTTTRNVFADEDSDRDGYTMVRFTDTENAKFADGKGDNTVALKESCKLYLKLAEPELVKFLFDQDVKHTTDKVTVTTTGTPVYDNGAKGESATFVLEEPETFKCLDEFVFEKVAEVSETTGAMEKDGEVVKTKQTKNVKSGEYTGTYTYYKYEQKYRQTITCNGETKYQHWLATWYDDFSFVVKSFENKNYAKVGSYSAIVEKDANHLTKSTSLSTEDLEVWLYSINGTFKLDNVERKDIGNGRITKVVIGENYWDEATKGREITALEVKSWCEFIRFKSDGTKTSQKYTHVFNRVSGTSTWEVSAEKAEEVNGNIIPLAPVDNNRIDDFCHFTARLYEYDMTVDIQGAAQQKDFAKFTEAEEMYFEVEGKKVYFENPTHSISNTVRNLTVKSENDSETVYQHENVWSWNYGGVVTNVTSTGLIHVAKSTPVNPDFDIEVGKIYASVSRPSNRNASDITAYTYLLVSKDGKKCLPLGIYHDVVTVGEITDMQEGFNSACYVKDQNKVVATRAYSDSGLGMMVWCGADGNPVDAASHITLQGAGFNDRGNDWINHTGKYAPHAEEKNGVTVVTFGNISYTFKGWNV